MGSQEGGGQNSPQNSPSFGSKERGLDIGLAAAGFFLTVAGDELSQWAPKHPWWQWWPHAIYDAGYGIEHLGVVLFVAVVIRVIIEKSQQIQFLRIINSQVSGQVRESIDSVATQSLEPLRQSVTEIKGQIETSISHQTTESLKPLQTALTKVEGSIGRLDEELGYTIRRAGILDDNSQKILKEKVLNPDFIRTDYTLSLTLEPLSTAREKYPDLLRVRTRTFFKLKNVTDEPHEYAITAWVDTINEPPGLEGEDRSRFTRFAYDLEGRGRDREIPISNVERSTEKDRKIEGRNGGLWLKYLLDGPIAPHSTYYVEVEAIQVNRKRDVFVWNLTGLTKMFNLTVHFAGGFHGSDFQVDARELHHIEHDDFRNSYKVGADGSVSWSIGQVLLPYQGVELWWNPAPPRDPGREA
jgi:hypothetical protein